jgi:hypothetical protein
MPAGLALEDSLVGTTSKRVPARYRLLGLLAAALDLPCVGPVALAGAQNWSGSITAEFSWAASDPTGSITHRETVGYYFDGSEPDSATSATVWSQPVRWEATYFEAQSADGICKAGEVGTRRSTGSGTGSQPDGGLVEFFEPVDSLPWRYAIAASEPDVPAILITDTCDGAGGSTRPAAIIGADSSDAGGTGVRHFEPFGPGETPETKSQLSGSRTVPRGDGTVTISWSLTRAGSPPQCSNGRDDDGDGATDYSGGVLGLRDPGCESDQDASEADGTIVIDKQTEPDPAADSFGFTGPAGAFSLTNGAATHTITVAPGSHQVTEDPPAAGWSLSAISCDDSASTGDPASRPATVQVAAGETVSCIFINSRVRPLTVDVTAGYEYFGGVRGPGALVNGFDFVRTLGEPDALARIGQICVRSWWRATTKLGALTTTPMVWNGEVGPFTNPDWTLVARTTPSKRGKGIVSETVRLSACGAPALVRLPLDPLTITSPGNMKSLSHWTVAEVYSTGALLLGTVTAQTGSFSKKTTPQRGTPLPQRYR